MIQATSPLRLYTGQDNSSTNDAPFWTIREAFENQKLPEMQHKDRAELTIAKWLKAIWYWEQVTDNPPISLITAEMLTEFPKRLMERDRRFDINTHTTANANQMYIQGVLRACDEHLVRIPRGWPLPAQAPTKHRRIVPPDALDAMFRACHVARYDHRRCMEISKSIPAPLLMRTALTLFLTAGCRRTEGWKMDASAYRRQTEFPDLPGFEVDAESPHGWLVFHTPKTKKKKNGLPLVLPVGKLLATFLDELDRLAPRRRRLIPLGDAPSTWKNAFNRVQRAAGIEVCYTWQDLRKTTSRAYRKIAGREVAKYMLGHQPRGVNATYYDDLTEDAVFAVAKLQLPDCFHEVG